MKKIITLLLVITFINSLLYSQCNGRYQTDIFSSVDITSNINYSDMFSDNEHKMDIYTGAGDTEINRPLILFVHGGSFFGGDKSDVACVDFCTEFAKKGYVVVSPNYRLVPQSNIINFLTNQEEQYEAVLKAVSDIKAAIRYFRKDFVNGDNYGIDPTTIFVGGNSAGGIVAIHLAYIDSISDLPTSPLNIQSIVNNLGGLEGDAGNVGYSSDVSGVISFAGGINNVNWIDSNDEPLVSCQGDADQTVYYNCGPGLGQPSVLELCGSGEMHPQASVSGIINTHLVFPGADHGWCSAGNNDPLFTQAMDVTKNFLYPLLPCNNTTSMNELSIGNKLVKIIDMLGRETKIENNTPLFFIYDDGAVEQKIIIE